MNSDITNNIMANNRLDHGACTFHIQKQKQKTLLPGRLVVV
jgi:hypothetical protein